MSSNVQLVERLHTVPHDMRRLLPVLKTAFDGDVAAVARSNRDPGPTPYFNSTICSSLRGLTGGSSSTQDSITVTFHDDKDGSDRTVRVPLGTSLLEAAHENEVDLEGACEGSLACSTCHVIVEDQGLYDSLPEPTDEENDMLDLAFGLTETSRLGCQILATPELDGLTVRIPSATRNFAVDGYVPKPH